MTKKQVSPEWQFGARLAFALQKQAVFDETLSFKSSPAPKPTAPSLSGSAPSRGAFMQGGLKTPALSAKPPAMRPMRGTPTTWQNMRDNAGRVSSGFLGTAAVTAGTIGSAVVGGLNMAYNNLVPRFMETPAWVDENIGHAFDASRKFTYESAANVANGLSPRAAGFDAGWGDRDYQNDRTTNMLEAGYNDPSLSPTQRSIAQSFGDAGNAAWGAAQAVTGGQLAGAALKAAPGGAAAANTVSNAYGRVPLWLKQTGSYLSGVPLTSQVNNAAVLGAGAAQSTAGGFLGQLDRLNAARGDETNMAGYVPQNAIWNTIGSVVTPEGASALNENILANTATPGMAATFLMAPHAENLGRNLAGIWGGANQEAAPPPEPGLDQPRDVKPLVGPDAAPAPTAVADAQPQTAAPAARDPFEDVPETTEQAAQPAEFKLPETAPPGAQEQVDEGLKAVGSLPEEKIELGKAAVTDPNSAAAKQLQEDGKATFVDDASRDPNNPPPTDDPNAYGNWLGGVMDNYEKLDPNAKIALGLGLGMGLIGLLMSFSEEGGVGGFLAAALGLGVAGTAAAGGGMFGDGAQQMVGSGLRGLANMAGAGIPEEGVNLSKLLKNPADAAQAGGGGLWNTITNIASDPSYLSKQVAQADQLKQLTNLPKFLALPLLRSLDPTNIKTMADAELAYTNAMQMRQQLDDPNSALAQRLAQARTLAGGTSAVGQGIDKAKNVASSWWDSAKSTFGG